MLIPGPISDEANVHIGQRPGVKTGIYRGGRAHHSPRYGNGRQGLKQAQRVCAKIR